MGWDALRSHLSSLVASHPACGRCSFLTICRHLASGKVTHIKSAFLMVTPGILGQQASRRRW